MVPHTVNHRTLVNSKKRGEGGGRLLTETSTAHTQDIDVQN